MNDADPPVLIVPGWGGSGPDHWQTTWQRELHAPRVELADWFEPACDVWIGALDRAVIDLERSDSRAPVLVAHSLGCIVVARWLHTTSRSIRAAMLVAPADVDRAPVLNAFGPVPRRRLPIRSLIVASDDDPYVSASRAKAFATSWGSELHFVPSAGHLNAESGLGGWATGRRLLRTLFEQELASATGGLP